MPARAARALDALDETAASQITSMYTSAQLVELLTAQHQPRLHNITPAAEGTISVNAGLT
jgi:hypothetical protein